MSNLSDFLPIPQPFKLDSIVKLTSGTSWTVPADVTLVVGYLEGGSGGGFYSTNNVAAGSGGGGGVKFLAEVTPGGTATYSIGAGGAAGKSGSAIPGAGGSTTMTIAGNSYTAQGGGAASASVGAGGYASGADAIRVYGQHGVNGTRSGDLPNYQARGAFGFGRAGRNGTSTTAGSAGMIVLELYK